MNKDNGIYKKNSNIFKAVSDEKRLMILEMLQDGDICACEIIKKLGIGQPNLSHHMKILCASGIVKSHKVGKWMHYEIDPSGRDAAIKLLMDLTQFN
ncbi:MAG TPA: ArsR family transcriptional regulator [Syntrophomonas sp.]|jgi:ArsR family transcriptional regulator|nr:ArsR family transcriptional regulator [Syntrophomonas sp.]